MAIWHSIRAWITPASSNRAQISEPTAARFGTFTGVFIPNITMMFGVILFLRLGLITAYTGTFAMSAIIVASALLMLLTSFSITSIVTNMKVGGGGVYYLISRSLGIEIGGAIGVILYLSQVISIALCTSGFAYSIQELFPNVSIDLVELATLVLLAILSFFSADWALKTQTAIFALIMGAVASVFLSPSYTLSPASLQEYFPQGLSFWQAFAMFFPAMTGIEAGMAMSGSLKTPSRSLAIGNIISVFVAFSVYLSLALYIDRVIPTDILKSDPMVLLQYVRWPAMLYVGIWAATLSSVLGGVLGAPRMLQTIAEDSIVPRFLGKTHGPLQEPRIATVVTFLLAVVVTYGTSIDQIIPILAMVRLITYCILNLVAAFSELIGSPSWRPSVRVPWWISALGAASCFFVMFMIDAGWTFASMLLVATGYLLLAKRQMQVAFRDIRSSVLFYFSRLTLYRLASAKDKQNHWHPQLLVFTAMPQNQEKMIHLCQQITRRSGILTCATLLPPDWSKNERAEQVKKTLEGYYDKHGISCLVEAVDSQAPYEGIAAMVKTYGVGPIYPNTIVMGMPQPHRSEEGLFEILQIAKDCKKNIILFHDNEAVQNELYHSKARGVNKYVDVWWDGDYRASFELMLSYLKLLTDDITWKRAKVCIKAIVSCEHGRASLMSYLNEYLEKNRLNYDIQVYVHLSEHDLLGGVSHYSHQAHLLLVPLRPIDRFGSKQEYQAYYKQMSSGLKKLAPTLLVSGYDQLNHRHLYQVSN